ncbi:TM1802 family CRISPR-associated protein [Tepidibacillus decaturensis]|uniref:Uncharacterized protein n=1 Tax=Tepidibacillus decaturensis TaxID=1413211 RepID=A0A135L268_9BACI|nr:TM1802 family CRISPR-associated protein [Tepidibacillus decaturensis]KXG43092.1 hypothetical protein U473_02915 [Tepidibacillus decaturensis]
MIEGFVQIGKAVGYSIESLVEKAESIRKNKVLQVLKLNFKENSLEVDVTEEMTDDSARKYLYINQGKGNIEMWYATSTKLDNFLTETLYNLTKKILETN